MSAEDGSVPLEPTQLASDVESYLSEIHLVDITDSLSGQSTESAPGEDSCDRAEMDDITGPIFMARKTDELTDFDMIEGIMGDIEDEEMPCAQAYGMGTLDETPDFAHDSELAYGADAPLPNTMDCSTSDPLPASREDILRAWRTSFEELKADGLSGIDEHEHEMEQGVLNRQGVATQSGFLDPLAEHDSTELIMSSFTEAVHAQVPRWLTDFIQATIGRRMPSSDAFMHLCTTDERWSAHVLSNLLYDMKQLVSEGLLPADPDVPMYRFLTRPIGDYYPPRIDAIEHAIAEAVRTIDMETSRVRIGKALRKMIVHALYFTAAQLRVVYEFPDGSARRYPHSYMRQALERILSNSRVSAWMNVRQAGGFGANWTWLFDDDMVTAVHREIPSATSTQVALKALSDTGDALAWIDEYDANRENPVVKLIYGAFRHATTVGTTNGKLNLNSRVFYEDDDAISCSGGPCVINTHWAQRLSKDFGYIPNGLVADYYSPFGHTSRQVSNRIEDAMKEALQKALLGMLSENIMDGRVADHRHRLLESVGANGVELVDAAMGEMQRAQNQFVTAIEEFARANQTDIRTMFAHRHVREFLTENLVTLEVAYTTAMEQFPRHRTPDVVQLAMDILSRVYPVFFAIIPAEDDHSASADVMRDAITEGDTVELDEGYAYNDAELPCMNLSEALRTLQKYEETHTDELASASTADVDSSTIDLDVSMESDDDVRDCAITSPLMNLDPRSSLMEGATLTESISRVDADGQLLEDYGGDVNMSGGKVLSMATAPDKIEHPHIAGYANYVDSTDDQVDVCMAPIACVPHTTMRLQVIADAADIARYNEPRDGIVGQHDDTSVYMASAAKNEPPAVQPRRRRVRDVPDMIKDIPGPVVRGMSMSAREVRPSTPPCDLNAYGVRRAGLIITITETITDIKCEWHIVERVDNSKREHERHGTMATFDENTQYALEAGMEARDSYLFDESSDALQAHSEVSLMHIANDLVKVERDITNKYYHGAATVAPARASNGYVVVYSSDSSSDEEDW